MALDMKTCPALQGKEYYIDRMLVFFLYITLSFTGIILHIISPDNYMFITYSSSTIIVLR